MVRALTRGDWEAWKPLWDGYLDFYRADVDAETSGSTFERLCEGTDRMYGLLALDDSGAAVGLAHLILHPATWTTSTYCYLEDLFVAKHARGGGVAEELFVAVYEEADRAGASRVYWHTQEFNAPARSLYDKLGHRTSFVVYER